MYCSCYAVTFIPIARSTFASIRLHDFDTGFVTRGSLSESERTTVTAVMIVDSHPIVREGIKRILSGAGIEVRSEGADAEQAIRALKVASCDVIFLDLSRPGPSGFQ